MLTLLALWLLLYFLFAVIGAGVVQAAGPDWPAQVSQPETTLAGLVSVLGILQINSIFLPTNFCTVAGLLVLAVLINSRLGNRPVHQAGAWLASAGRHPLFWLLLVVVVLYALPRTTNPDSGTYHLPAIRYAERFAVIPGLGNLFSRLAFNSGFFVVGAAFGFTDLAGQTLFPLNGFLLLLFGGAAIGSGQTEPQSAARLGMQAATVGLSLFFLVRQANAPTPDVWATVLPLVVLMGVLLPQSPPTGFRTFLWLALIFTSVTIKLTTLPLLLLVPILAWQHSHQLRWQHGLWVLALAGLLIGPWLVRNVLLSGYLVFPLTELDLFSVDWKIPANVGQYEQNIITHWARFHLDEAAFDPQKLTWPFWQWVRWWWIHWWFWYNWPNRPTFMLALLSPVVVLMQWLHPSARQQMQAWLPVYGVALAGFWFWFLRAPEFRFGYAFVWITGLLPLTTWLRQALATAMVPGLMGAVLLGLLVYFVIGQVSRSPLVPANLVLPHKLDRFDPTARHIYYQLRLTRSGLGIVVPNAPNEPCFDIEQPCTPFFFSDLQLRGKLISDGFRRNQTATDSLRNHIIKLSSP